MIGVVVVLPVPVADLDKSVVSSSWLVAAASSNVLSQEPISPEEKESRTRRSPDKEDLSTASLTKAGEEKSERDMDTIRRTMKLKKYSGMPVVCIYIYI